MKNNLERKLDEPKKGLSSILSGVRNTNIEQLNFCYETKDYERNLIRQYKEDRSINLYDKNEIKNQYNYPF